MKHLDFSKKSFGTGRKAQRLIDEASRELGQHRSRLHRKRNNPPPEVVEIDFAEIEKRVLMHAAEKAHSRGREVSEEEFYGDLSDFI